MDRRDFLKRTGGVAASAATAATAGLVSADPARADVEAPAVVSGIRELRLVHAWPDNGQGFADSARRLTQRISVATGGRLRFTTVSSSKPGLAAVTAGEADVYHASELDHLDLHKGLAYFAALPGYNGLRPSSLDAWMLSGGGQALWDGLAGELGVKALAAGHTGRSAGLWIARPLAGLDDLSGRNIWSMGLARDVVRGLGAEPSSLPPQDVAAALDAGELAAAEAGGSVASLALGVRPRERRRVGIAINRTGVVLSLGFSRAVWDSFGESDRAIIAAVSSAELHTAIAEEKAHRQLLLGEAPGKPQGSLREVEAAVARVSDAVVAHVAAGDAWTRRINESYVAFRQLLGFRRVVWSA